jgi:hypothetical protein
MLLYPPIYNALVARWAWFAFRDNVAPSEDLERLRQGESQPEQDWADVVEALGSEILRVTARTIRDAPRLPSDQSTSEYASKLARRLRSLSADNGDLVIEAVDVYWSEYLSPLTGMVDVVHDTARNTIVGAVRAYQKYSDRSLPSLDVVTRTAISADWSRTPPATTFARDFVGDARVSNGCGSPCCEHQDIHTQTLQLTVVPSHFDSSTFAGLPFVLFHEAVSHVLQGPDGLDREVPDRDSQFAEGWMDRAAIKVLEDVLFHRVPIGAGGYFPHPFREELVLDAARRLCSQRNSLPAVSPTTTYRDRTAAARRSLGWRAAHQVVHAYERMGADDSDTHLLRLSFAINRSDWTASERDEFVEIVLLALRPAGPAAVERHRRAERALSRYANDWDMDSLRMELRQAAEQVN